VTIEVKVLSRGDEDVLTSVAAGVFDNPVDPVLTREFLADHRHHIAVAIDNGLVVGFASAVHYIHPDKLPELWVNEVAVAPGYQRRGLGKALLKALLEVGRALNCTEAWVLTDRSNLAAMALYLSRGGAEGVGGAGSANPIVGYTFDLRERRKFGTSN
jgi:ribosomal protein S18 acetylase RimI-like enzyme